MAIPCLPDTLRIELVPNRVVSIGYKFNSFETIEMLRDRQAWRDMQAVFQSAALGLADLHKKHGVYHGGFHPTKIGFVGEL